MVDTVLFDLDGTLLQLSQDDFIGVYFAELKKVFERLGMDADYSIKAVWAGTKAMILNDGAKSNAERFWETFANVMGLSGDRLKAIENACDSFYTKEFDAVKSVLKNKDLEQPRRLMDAVASKGYTAVLATNPLFPTCAVTTRLAWIGLKPEDFSLITNYSNSRYSKPSLGYYRDILAKTDKQPEQCLMIGNNVKEDMCAETLGMEVYLVTGHVINEGGEDISAFRHGSLDDLERELTER
jgi:FMN phosphatase YigB (HAD superfamily)